MKTNVSLFWFRRDLRLEDNKALHESLKSGFPVLPIFIFDKKILNQLECKKDRRVDYIHQVLSHINHKLKSHHSKISTFSGKPIDIFAQLNEKYEIQAVYCNRDYEPEAISRDQRISQFLKEKNIPFKTYKDQVIFEKTDSVFEVPKLDRSIIGEYHKYRDFPALERTTQLGVALRFGAISIRQCVSYALKHNETWLNELIWREFFMQILYHFPEVVCQSFRPQYEFVKWRNNEKEFELWCNGKTGYPIVDAGMRQLNQTGYMHNRVRMIVASFLCKHLLIDWRWGETYFAQKLNDYDLSANNGNWQWAAGSGCDAAPYFRIFNPTIQTNKFDKNLVYIKKWLPEYGTSDYPEPMIEHGFARDRALKVYRDALKVTSITKFNN